jgi:DNA-binding NtrC family response regulator
MSHNIAVLDADMAYRRLLKRMLMGRGYSATFLDESASAAAMIRRSLPKLVILDTWLEDREAGWRLLATLRAHPVTAQIPVLVCTADVATVRERTNQLAAWRCAVLEKPFDVDRFLALVDGLLDRGVETQHDAA